VLEVLTGRAELRVWPKDFPPPREQLLKEAREMDGLLTLLTDRVDRQLIEQAPKLRVVSNFAVGFDNIDVQACSERGIAVGNTPGVLTETTADLAFALMLAAARRIPEGIDFVRAGKWRTFDPNLLLGQDVSGAMLGIVGMGKIGQAVARRAAAFSMRILYVDKERADVERQTGAKRVEKETLLRESDFVSLHVPLTPKTRHYIGSAELALMKPSAILINTSRGPVVDQVELARGLAAGRPGAAALDVTDPEPISPTDPLLSMPNVIVVPHVGSASFQTRTRMGQLAVANLLAGLEGRPLPHPVPPLPLGEGQGEGARKRQITQPD
jgi:glyoxylate reductase